MTDRPSDADTAMVVAEQHDIIPAIPVYSTTGNRSLIGFVGLGGYEFEVKDPRDDPDAALELLRHIRTLIKDTGDVDYNDEGQIEVWWGIKGEGGFGYTQFSWTLPPSGEPFRYAVVALAVKVMGGGDV